MNMDELKNLNSAMNSINKNINNITEYFTNFNKNNSDIELKKIDAELEEIKKILDYNNISTDALKYSDKNTVLNSITSKLNSLRNDSNDSNLK